MQELRKLNFEKSILLESEELDYTEGEYALKPAPLVPDISTLGASKFSFTVDDDFDPTITPPEGPDADGPVLEEGVPPLPPEVGPPYYPVDDGPNEDGPNEDGPNEDGPNEDGPNEDGPNEDGPNEDGPNEDGPNEDGPNEDGPNEDGPNEDGPNEDGPNEDGPNEDGPNEDGPNEDGPNEDGPNEDGPNGGTDIGSNDRTKTTTEPEDPTGMTPIPVDPNNTNPPGFGPGSEDPVLPNNDGDGNFDKMPNPPQFGIPGSTDDDFNNSTSSGESNANTSSLIQNQRRLT